MVAGPAIQSGIIGDSASTATSDSQTQRGPFAQESTSTLDVDTTFTFELEMLVQTMLATILIGAFGAGIALVSTLKMSPAEALRYE